MGWGSCDAPEPAYEAGTQRRKGRLNAGTSCESMLPVKRARGQPVKPSQKKKLEAPGLSRGEDVAKRRLEKGRWMEAE